MHTKFNNSCRGAARHWVIGCLAVVAIFVLLLVGGGFFAYRWVKKNADFGTFDVASKMDPPATATADQLLPTKIGTFDRVAITSDTRELATLAGSVPGKPNTPDAPGTIGALYSDASRDSALVWVMNTKEAQQHNRGKANDPFTQMSNQPNSGQGVHVQSKIQGAEFGIAAWGKTNWTYAIMTTNTAALDFAQQFQPTKE
jgi:hypothetical protein